jgi:hypothetical protein
MSSIAMARLNQRGKGFSGRDSSSAWFRAGRLAWLIGLGIGILWSHGSAAQELLVPTNSVWRLHKGTNEASSPVTAWRLTNFNDAAWTTNAAPFHYGEGLSGGTLLSDMRSNYTCVYLRTFFVLTNLAQIARLTLRADYDDGFVAWVNGTEVTRSRVGNTYYTNVASSTHEGGVYEVFTSTATAALARGTNILAVQAFNQSLTSADFRFIASLEVERDAVPPVLAGVLPQASAPVSALTEIRVDFSEPVFGVNAGDLRVSDQPAAMVVGVPGTNSYLFTFTQPPAGQVTIEWDAAHGITDTAGNPFDSEASSASWNYLLADFLSPEVVQVAPVPNAEVSRLGEVVVTFNEPVIGVDAADLLVNGLPATTLSGAESGPYLFSFPSPAPGPVTLSWAPGHGITDASPAANAFGGGNWQIQLNPQLLPSDLVINEFVAENSATNSPLDYDEDGELQDWIELFNRGTNPVNLLGWSLTDSASQLRKWIFPSLVLQPGEYLLVYASEKDRRPADAGSRLHTNFKLNPFGEYLALCNAEEPPVLVSVLSPEFPEQRNDHSYGLNVSNQWQYFASPTPLAPNGASLIQGILSPPHFSVGRGIFDQPFQLLLTTTNPVATIRYTLDGSEPTETSGAVYSAPIQITNTVIVRAAAFGSNHLPSRTVTHSYLFLDYVLNQPDAPPGFPANWGTKSGFPDNLIPADYGMDLDPLRVNPDDPGSPIAPEKLERFRQGLRELPWVSIVMSVEDMFGAGGLHPLVQQKTPVVEKACSIEMILPDGATAFALEAGLRMHGNASRDPLKNPKHGFKLNFTGDYGESKLKYPLFEDSAAEEFDDLLLRADFNSSWRHWSDVASNGNGAYQRSRGTRTRYAWSQETMRALGHPAPRNRYCHLFINGLYWGTYDFSEQATETFAQTHYPSPAGHDIYEQGQLRAGSDVAYKAMLAITNLADNASYLRIQQYLDVSQFIDYTLLHFFVGHQDWGNTKNWYAIRPRAPGDLGRFRYIPWDQECILLEENVNRVPNAGGSTDVPSNLHTKLDDNPQFRLDFADRAHRHLVAPNGVLTPLANILRWQKWKAVLDKPIVLESMRWGDYRRDVHPYLDGTFQLYTREQHWLAENSRLENSYFLHRTATLLSQLRTAGLYPSVDAPEFRQGSASGPLLASRTVPDGFVLAMNNPGGAGTIYYTTNGADPRVRFSGQIASDAIPYSNPLTLNTTVTFKARVFHNNTWSALNEATFSVAALGLPLAITEIMYNPVGGEAFEYVELQNVGSTVVDLSGFSFDGIDYIFPPGAVLNPGAVVLLASSADTNAFRARYPSAAVFGWFGGALSNGGERIALRDPNLGTVLAVNYDDENGWPTAPDGLGYSLEIVDPRGDPDAPANWRPSATVNGSPGLPPIPPSAPPSVVLNEVMAHNLSAVSNAGTFPDWIELFNAGSAPVALQNWSLSDATNPRKFVFPAGITLNPGQFLVVWCDSDTNAPGVHTGFALDKDGETLRLFDAATNTVDALTFGLQVADLSLSRLAGGWDLSLPTPGSSNQAAPLAAATNLSVNEWLAAPLTGDDTWIELYNRSLDAPVSLRGLYFRTATALYQVRSLSYLPPGGFVQLWADEKAGASHLGLKLSSSGFIELYSPTASLIERVNYTQAETGVSQGRLPDGEATVLPFPRSQSPGAPNYLPSFAGPNFSEILARNRSAVLSPWGTYADWIELENPGSVTQDLSGLVLADFDDEERVWSFPTGLTLAPGGLLLVWCDESRPPSTLANPPLNTGFALGGSGGALRLLDAGGRVLDQLDYGPQLEDRSVGRNGTNWVLLASPSPGAANSSPAALGALTNLCINEWMAQPESGNDWFELYNKGELPLELSGVFLTDDPSVTGLQKSPVHPLTFVDGRSWLKFIADGAPAQGPTHAAFSLNSLGETLRLYAPSLTLLDAVDFGVQTRGVSVGRLPDGSANFVSFPLSPSPEESNFLPLTNIVINEVLAHTDAPLEDAIEIHNPSLQPVDIGGWFLSDRQTDLKRFRIPSPCVIPAGGYRVFYQYQFGPADGEEDVPPLFSLNSAYGDQVHLSQADALGNLTGHRAAVSFGASANGISFGPYQTSVGSDFVALQFPTLGITNPASLAQFRSGTGAPNAGPLVGPVVISEIMYQPPSVGTNPAGSAGIEFIELQNLTGVAVPLYDPAHPTNRWKLAGAVSFDFPPNTILAPGGLLVVVPFDPISDLAERARFEALYGTNAALAGPYRGKLDNAGESLELYRPDAPQAPPRPDAGFVPAILVERVRYSPEEPWPAAAAGTGASLQRLQAAGYGNDPANWAAAQPSPGLPLPTPDADGDGLPDGWEQTYGTNPNVADAHLDSDLDGLTNYQEYLAGTHPLDPQSCLRLSISPGSGSVWLEFLAVSNRSYSILFRDSLAGTGWSRLLDLPAHPTNRTHHSLLPTTNAPSRLYRLVTPSLP